MMSAAQSQNHVEMQKYRADLAKLNSELGIKSSNVFIPMFLQIPFGYGCYRVVSGMAHLSVGLAAEQFAWIKDLTVADPFYILPLLTSGFLFMSLRKGGEFGNLDQSQQQMRKLMMYGMPAIQFLFLAFFPAALQMYFMTTGLFGLTQAYMLSSSSFRAAVGITIPQQQLPTDTSGITGPDTGRALLLLTQAIEHEKAEIAKTQKAAGNEPNLSFIDRAINNIKESKNQFTKETTKKLEEMSGKGPKTNADGSLAEPARLSDKDRKLAEDYEKRRKEEEDWKREERNFARREAHLKALEREREKAKSAFKNPSTKQ